MAMAIAKAGMFLSPEFLWSGLSEKHKRIESETAQATRPIEVNKKLDKFTLFCYYSIVKNNS